jgi:hypothetical protein
LGFSKPLTRAASQHLVADRCSSTEFNHRLKERDDALFVDESVKLTQDTHLPDVGFFQRPLGIFGDFLAGTKLSVAELDEIPFLQQRVARDSLAIDVRPVCALQVPHRENLAGANQVCVCFGNIPRRQDQVALGVPPDMKRI